MTTPRRGAPGTTDQRPTWEGPPENRPAGYLPAEDNPAIDRDAAGENLQDPPRSNLSDALTTGGDMASREARIRTRAYQLWEQGGQTGSANEHWSQAEGEIDAEATRPSGIQSKSGAGSAIAAHSKDAHVGSSGRKLGNAVDE